jgi:uncharacterized membrane protein
MVAKQNNPQVFTSTEENAIQSAIAQAELLTSGEIRLFIDDHCQDSDPFKKATVIFQKLKMHKTKERNGVLIYLAVLDQKFAIIGDKGIHEKVGDDFWNETKELILTHFKNNQVLEGLIAGIKKAGQKLSSHFPRHENDRNEISNKVVFKL